MPSAFFIAPASPASDDAIGLLAELSAQLAGITGSSGAASFDVSSVSVPRSLFVVARNEAGAAIGCGALRPLSDEIAEIKRMYSKQRGAGHEILKYLATKALEMNYKELRLETRRVNETAVNFYLRNGFRPIPNYGKYVGRGEAICLAKKIADI
jgi:GNAT superfamily N-acetyltransferase